MRNLKVFLSTLAALGIPSAYLAAAGSSPKKLFIQCQDHEDQQACRQLLEVPAGERKEISDFAVFEILCQRRDSAACKEASQLATKAKQPREALRMLRKACKLGEKTACLEVSNLANSVGAKASAKHWSDLGGASN